MRALVLAAALIALTACQDRPGNTYYTPYAYYEPQPGVSQVEQARRDCLKGYHVACNWVRDNERLTKVPSPTIVRLID
jgi:hypothetical protein